MELPDARRYADFVYAPFQNFNAERRKLGGAAKLCRPSVTTQYPACYGIYSNECEEGARVHVQPDASLKAQGCSEVVVWDVGQLDTKRLAGS